MNCLRVQVEKFDCPVCRQPMELRTGKYGDFFYCREHGTINASAAYRIHRLQTNDIAVNTPVLFREDSLLDAVKRTGVAMGHHQDEMGRLVDWIIDNEACADWDEDHWMNVRPY